MAESHSPEAVALAERFELAEGSWAAVSKDVAEERANVEIVYHDPDGGWWFTSTSDEPVVPQCLPCLLTRHPEVAELADLALNHAAFRRADGWKRTPRPAEWGPWERDD